MLSKSFSESENPITYLSGMIHRDISRKGNIERHLDGLLHLDDVPITG